ncbi:Ig-like domain-containing protein [uncultured Thiothrix sp.]|uniref:Ig-like domain-containing protein n=1 Tax=uncultured Thiothrix sp. TaxID=223185 RepID=UPI00261498BC|nr:Ig-like domain-containing protein [uncultured Thiothrix sp.]
MIKPKSLAFCLAAALGLASYNVLAYDFDASQTNAQNNYSPALSPLFDPTNGIIPSTNDLLFRGSTDGTLNIPTTNLPASKLPLYEAINSLDGFALTAPITTAFSNVMDASTVKVGSSVYVYEVKKDLATGAVTSIEKELTAADIYATPTADGKTLVLVPLKPLKESTGYMVVLTNSIKDKAGKAAASSSYYLLAKATQSLANTPYAALEPLRQLIGTQEAAAVGKGVAKQRIILSWTFTTQSVTPVLQAAVAQAKASKMLMSPALGTTKTFSSNLRGKANVHIGSLDLPYYLNAKAPLTSYWQGVGDSNLTRYNPTPKSKSTQTVPVLMSVPNATSLVGATPPATGWPVIIFQHGITRSRLDMLAIADTMADVGFAVVAIDLPLHGITDNTNPLKADLNPAFSGDVERTFNLDLRNNSTGATGADGIIDSSGSYFINLSSLRTSRDNIRQGISDLTVLRKSLGSIQSMSPIPLDTKKVGFVGISLGSMVGTGYLSQEATSTPATLAVPGGGIARLLDGSETFGPAIQQGLAASGVIKGTAAYDTFMAVAQWVSDPADPIVLGKRAAAKHPIHMMEVVGLNGVGSDKVIPNRVVGAPLSGTEPLISVMGLKSITQTGTPDGVVRFTEGVHGSLLDPSSSLAATTEMQAETAVFQVKRGAAIPVFNPAVVKQ